MTKRFENAVLAAQFGTTIPDEYDMTLTDIQALLKMGFSGDHDRIYEAIITAFRFGFVMGNRATINRNMKKL